MQLGRSHTRLATLSFGVHWSIFVGISSRGPSLQWPRPSTSRTTVTLATPANVR
jgi:hypothetical protein